MSNLQPRQEYLVGSWLLGKATVEELAELAVQRKQDHRLEEILRLLEKSESSFHISAAGAPAMAGVDRLPAWTEPPRLAESLKHMNESLLLPRWVRLSANVGVFLLMTPLFIWQGWRFWQSGDLFSSKALPLWFVVLAYWICYPALLLWLRKDRTAKIADGGSEWRKQVTRLSRFRARRFLSAMIVTNIVVFVVGIFIVTWIFDDRSRQIRAMISLFIGAFGILWFAFRLAKQIKRLKGEEADDAK